MRVIYNSLKSTESFQNPFHKINRRVPLTKEEKLKKTFYLTVQLHIYLKSNGITQSGCFDFKYAKIAQPYQSYAIEGCTIAKYYSEKAKKYNYFLAFIWVFMLKIFLVIFIYFLHN